MKKFSLECMYAVDNFKDHQTYKHTLLNLINSTDSVPVIDNGCETNISRADWHDATNFKREWTRFFADYYTNPILDLYKELGYDGYTLHELWFQQYEKNSGHGWHAHSANFTNVYYLELPDEAPKTQLVSPFNQQEIIEVDVREGDILIFPSFVIHKAPENKSSKRKTIISYNINATYSNAIYGQGIKEDAFF